METPQSKTAWFDILKNYIPAIVVIGGLFYNVVLTWKDIGDNKEAIHDLEDKVTRQYSVQRERNDNADKAIEDVKDWVEWQKRYKQARKELKK
mgnify:CR=1 FL=1